MDMILIWWGGIKKKKGEDRTFKLGFEKGEYEIAESTHIAKKGT